jgi:hypothetical protein
MRTALARTAAKRGQTACLRVILGTLITLDGWISSLAARAGSLPCLHLAHWHKDKWEPGTVYNAAFEGAGRSFVFGGFSYWTA